MTKIGTVIDGKYEILTEIGRGGMSVVYLAMDKRLNKQWAIKEVLKAGYRTIDIMSEGKELVGTVKMGDLIVEEIKKFD